MNTAVISTPNRHAYGSHGEEPDNRFHTREYDLGEFDDLLLSRFTSTDLFAQRRRVRSETRRRVDALARRIRDRLGLRGFLPPFVRDLARRAADAYDPDPRVVPLEPGDRPLYYVAVANGPR